jgi:hypothetical protein
MPAMPPPSTAGTCDERTLLAFAIVIPIHYLRFCLKVLPPAWDTSPAYEFRWQPYLHKVICQQQFTPVSVYVNRVTKSVNFTVQQKATVQISRHQWYLINHRPFQQPIRPAHFVQFRFWDLQKHRVMDGQG